MEESESISHITAEQLLRPIPGSSGSVITNQEKYIASLFTQLVINNIDTDRAIHRAKDAAKYLSDNKLPYPEIIVG